MDATPCQCGDQGAIKRGSRIVRKVGEKNQKNRWLHFCFYKQVFYEQPCAQITKHSRTLLSRISASDLVPKVICKNIFVQVAKNTGEKVKICKFIGKFF